MFEALSGLQGWEYVAGCGLLAGISFAGAWGRQWLAARKINPVSRAVEGMAQIYDSLNELAARAECDRALIVYTANGGGIPNTRTPVYCTVLYELVHSPGLSPIRQGFQQIPADRGYVKMLQEVMTRDQFDMDTDSMPRGFLHDSYTLEGVKSARNIELLRTPERYYFLSLYWHRPRPADAVVDLACVSARSQIRTLLSKY